MAYFKGSVVTIVASSFHFVTKNMYFVPHRCCFCCMWITLYIPQREGPRSEAWLFNLWLFFAGAKCHVHGLGGPASSHATFSCCIDPTYSSCSLSVVQCSIIIYWTQNICELELHYSKRVREDGEGNGGGGGGQDAVCYNLAVFPSLPVPRLAGHQVCICIGQQISEISCVKCKM
jgi:hypothetical protein